MSTDKNLLSFGPELCGSNIDHPAELDGAGYSDTVKCSNLHGFEGAFGVVKSGSEDAADINNHCRDISLSAQLWVLRGKMGFTVKGGSTRTMLTGLVAGHGQETDVDLGNWSDQSHDKTTDIVLGLRHANGEAIRVRVLHSDIPIFVPYSGPYEFVFPSPHMGRRLHGVIVWIFMTLRRWGFFR